LQFSINKNFLLYSQQFTFLLRSIAYLSTGGHMGEIAEALPALVRRWKYVEGVPVFLDRRIRGAFTQRNKTTNGLMALAL
jgi:hypothetical protein